MKETSGPIPDNDPPTVVTNEVSTVTTTSATLSGNVTSDGGAAVTERGFVYGGNANPAIGGAGVTKVMSNCKVTAICNQKGGVTKTTTTANLGIGLAMQGKKVLLVDIDLQADLTASLGWPNSDALPMTLIDIMEKTLHDEDFEHYGAILRHDEGVDLIPSSIELSGMEMSLVNAMGREFTLRNYLEQIKHNYDYVLIDCLPSLSMLTINALATANSVIVPVQAQYLPAKGMTQLMRTIGKIRRQINPNVWRNC